jgi:hypothetical protein
VFSTFDLLAFPKFKLSHTSHTLSAAYFLPPIFVFLAAELLIQIDGIGSSSTPGQVMVLATTNRPWDLDEALRRRLEKRIYIPLPDEKARLAMLKISVRKVRMSSSMDLGKIAKNTENFSGADMHNLCRDACMNPMRRVIMNRSPEEIKMLKVRKIHAAFVSSHSHSHVCLLFNLLLVCGSGGRPTQHGRSKYG